MPGDNQKSHLNIAGYNTSEEYRYPRDVRPGFTVAERNRNIHGNNILRQMEQIRNDFDLPADADLPEGIVKEDALYVDFISEWGYAFKFETLEQDKDQGLYQILNIKAEERVENNETQHRYRVTVMLTRGGIGKFIAKVRQYLNENVVRQGEDTGNPKNQALVNNLEIIQQATLQSFWTDAPEIPFPDENANVWWEVWFRKTNDDTHRINRVLENLRIIGAEVGLSELVFAEHRVRLVRATAIQLSQSLLLLDSLAELRKPQETADFISHRSGDHAERTEWLTELQQRVQVEINENSVLICLLDSGVNNAHPLIAPFLPDGNLYSYKPDDWGTGDGWPDGGHGTGVAGIALYGDLVDVLASRDQVSILHGIESFKIIHSTERNSPELYGAITEFAVSAPIIDRPASPRVFCMTVTDEHFAFRGRPSAWSAAIDKIAFGSAFDPAAPQLFIVSAGNVSLTRHDQFPATNYLQSVHDPGQAYNAITVGTYTRKDRIDPNTGFRHLALNGAMAPTNSTSITWHSQWPLKPDIVMEGGNASTDGTDLSDHPALKLLSTDKEHNRFIFTPFGDTSAGAALAAKFSAELKTAYPNYWPETIRGLTIHSAAWTDAMLGDQAINNLNERQRFNLLRSVGYGVPLLAKALYSASNSLTLVAERTIQPYKLERGARKYNEYHLFELPWPTEVLRDQLTDQDVTLKITLSYFIEPNPGERRYANNFQYHSHSLDFLVIKPNETLPVFKRRVSSAANLPEDEIDNSGENWFIGRVRSRGSVKKDFITMSGADMAERKYIAIYPKNGWYKTRKKWNKAESVVRYSLIISIETPGVEVDLYTPVFTMVENILPV